VSLTFQDKRLYSETGKFFRKENFKNAHLLMIGEPSSPGVISHETTRGGVGGAPVPGEYGTNFKKKSAGQIWSDRSSFRSQKGGIRSPEGMLGGAGDVASCK